MKWEYTMMITNLQTGVMMKAPELKRIWEFKGADGLSDWERIQAFGQDGWELVNTHPLHVMNGFSHSMMWIFKRPVSG